MKGYVMGAVAIGCLASLAVLAAPTAPPPPPGPSPSPSPVPSPTTSTTTSTSTSTTTTTPTTATTVKIIFITVPMKKAMVFWGKKRLGVIAPHAPFVLQRPRDSGPLDVVVRADGYLPVQTRAYTFADSKVAVKLTALDQRNTLLGYREEVPPDGGVPEGGAPLATPAPARPDGGAR